MPIAVVPPRRTAANVTTTPTLALGTGPGHRFSSG